MVLNKQGEGYAWLASESVPFSIRHDCSTDGLSSALWILGAVGRLDIDGDVHYPEGIPASAQVEQALIDERRAAQQQQQRQTKRIPKAKKLKGVSKPKKPWELKIGADGEYRGGIKLPRPLPRHRCRVTTSAVARLLLNCPGSLRVLESFLPTGLGGPDQLRCRNWLDELDWRLIAQCLHSKAPAAEKLESLLRRKQPRRGLRQQDHSLD